MLSDTDRQIVARLARHNVRGVPLDSLIFRAQEILTELEEYKDDGMRLFLKAEHAHIMNEIERRQTQKWSGIIYANQNAIEIIKDRVNIETVVSWYTPVIVNGKDRRKFSCLMHGDTSPSGMLYLDQNSWYCFGCSKGGDIFDAVMHFEKQDFLYALNKLATFIGLDLSSPTLKAHPHPKSTEERLAGLEKAIGNHLKSHSVGKYSKKKYYNTYE